MPLQALKLVVLDDTEAGGSLFHPFQLFHTSNSLETGNGDTAYKFQRARSFAVCDREYGAMSLVMQDVVLWFRRNSSSHGSSSSADYVLEGVSDTQRCLETTWVARELEQSQIVAQKTGRLGWPLLPRSGETRFRPCTHVVNSSLTWLPGLVHSSKFPVDLISLQERPGHSLFCNFYIGAKVAMDDVIWVPSFDGVLETELQRVFLDFGLARRRPLEFFDYFHVGSVQSARSSALSSSFGLTWMRLDPEAPSWLLFGLGQNDSSAIAIRRQFLVAKAVAALQHIFGVFFEYEFVEALQ